MFLCYDCLLNMQLSHSGVLFDRIFFQCEADHFWHRRGNKDTKLPLFSEVVVGDNENHSDFSLFCRPIGHRGWLSYCIVHGRKSLEWAKNKKGRVQLSRSYRRILNFQHVCVIKIQTGLLYNMIQIVRLSLKKNISRELFWFIKTHGLMDFISSITKWEYFKKQAVLKF